jgi:HEPN domain-containing protein
MDRLALHDLSRQRRREAAALLKADLYPGAYYLAGYAVECALKACVAKQTKKHDFPDKHAANEVWTHDLQKLVGAAGLAVDLQRDLKASPALQLNWAIVKDWSEAVRYDLAITHAQARDLYSACTRRHSGVLSWIRKRW